LDHGALSASASTAAVCNEKKKRAPTASVANGKKKKKNRKKRRQRRRMTYTVYLVFPLTVVDLDHTVPKVGLLPQPKI
jgi:hypothetical protein